jgi:hypothetical protein
MTREAGYSNRAYAFEPSIAYLVLIIFIALTSLLPSILSFDCHLSLTGLVRRLSQAAPICMVQAGSDCATVLISSCSTPA